MLRTRCVETRPAFEIGVRIGRAGDALHPYRGLAVAWGSCFCAAWGNEEAGRGAARLPRRKWRLHPQVPAPVLAAVTAAVTAHVTAHVPAHVPANFSLDFVARQISGHTCRAAPWKLSRKPPGQ